MPHADMVELRLAFPNHADAPALSLSPDDSARPKRVAVVKGEVKLIRHICNGGYVKRHARAITGQIINDAAVRSIAVRNNKLGGLDYPCSRHLPAFSQHECLLNAASCSKLFMTLLKLAKLFGHARQLSLNHDLHPYFAAARAISCSWKMPAATGVHTR